MPKIALQRRERVLLIGGTILVVLVAAAMVGRGPWREYKASGVQLKDARDRLAQARQLRNGVVEAHRSQELLAEQIAARGAFDLYTFLNGALRSARLEKEERGANLKNARGVAATLAAVDLTLKGVSMEELVALLHTIYNGQKLVILHKMDNLGPSAEGKGLDCTMTFVSPKPVSSVQLTGRLTPESQS